MITRTETERARDLIRRSGVADDIEALLRPVEAGRPRALSVETFLVGLLLTVRHRKALTLINVHRVLTQDLALSLQRELGIRQPSPDGGITRAITVRQVRYVLEAINKRLEYTPEVAKGLDDDVRKARQDALQSILDKLLAATMPEHLTHGGAYAVDETGVWSWGRGKSTVVNEDTGEVETKSKDKDARWGYKTAKSGETEMYFGYGVFAFARIADEGAEPQSIPILTERIVVRPAATDVVEPILGGIDRLRAEGRSVTEIAADRAWSYKTPDRWANELRARGIEHTLDIHPNDAGVVDQDGMRMIAGSPHCPHTPDDVIDIKRPQSLGKGEALEEFIEKVSEREQYALRRVTGPNATGKERYQCPALAGKIRCPLRSLTAGFPAEMPSVTIPVTAVGMPPAKCCTQVSVTVPGEAQAKLRQRYYWGSRKWVDAYKRRTYVEGMFGQWKNRNNENVTRGWAQVVGIVKTSLLLGVAVAAANLRLLRAWAAEAGDHTDPLTSLDPDYTGFEELTPVTGPATATGPPPAA